MAVDQVNFLNSKNRQFLLPAKDKDLFVAVQSQCMVLAKTDAQPNLLGH